MEVRRLRSRASARELPRTFRETSAKTTGRFSDAVLPRTFSSKLIPRLFRGISLGKGICSLLRYSSKARAYIERELISKGGGLALEG